MTTRELKDLAHRYSRAVRHRNRLAKESVDAEKQVAAIERDFRSAVQEYLGSEYLPTSHGLRVAADMLHRLDK